MSGTWYLNKIVLANGTWLLDVATNPNGVGQAPKGSIASAADGTGPWLNTDGATGWATLATTFSESTLAASTDIPASDLSAQPFDQFISIPANFLMQGAVIDVAAKVDMSVVGVGNTYGLGIGINGNVVVAGEPYIAAAAPASPFSGSAYLRAKITIPAIGVGGQYSTVDHSYYRPTLVEPVPGFQIPLMSTPISAALNTTNPVLVQVIWNWTGGDPASIASLSRLAVTVSNPQN